VKHKGCGGRVLVLEESERLLPLLTIGECGSYEYDSNDKDVEWLDIRSTRSMCERCRTLDIDDEIEEDA